MSNAYTKPLIETPREIEEIEQRALMLVNANQYTDIGPTPEEIARREAAALDGLSEADVEIVRRRAHEIRQAQLMARL